MISHTLTLTHAAHPIDREWHRETKRAVTVAPLDFHGISPEIKNKPLSA